LGCSSCDTRSSPWPTLLGLRRRPVGHPRLKCEDPELHPARTNAITRDNAIRVTCRGYAERHEIVFPDAHRIALSCRCACAVLLLAGHAESA
jgi:hypothetical protein